MLHAFYSLYSRVGTKAWLRTVSINKERRVITIEQIIEELNRYIVDLKYSLEKNTFKLFAFDENGFDINIYSDPRESMIYFGNGGHHIHFQDIEEHFDEFIFGLVSSLTGNTRIIEFHWNNKPRKFRLEEKTENEEWKTISSMTFPNWMFWRKKTEIHKVVKVNNYQMKMNNVCLNQEVLVS